MSRIDRSTAGGNTNAIPLPTLPLPANLPIALQQNPGIRPIRVVKGSDVVVAGNHYDCWYFDHDGWLIRYKILHKGGRQILDFILPGEIFGLQACVFRNSLYSVAAITQTSLTAIPFAMIETMLEQTVLSKALLWSAICEAARLSEHVTNSARRSAYERVGHLLPELFVRTKRAGLASGVSFHAPLTQELIGDAVGLTTIHVNRTLRCLREDKLIEVDGKRVTILNFEALSLLCDFENSYLGENARPLWGSNQSLSS
jgi:CRP-like cAMP-binding protein